MRNNDFYILHLSDLHIKNTGKKKGSASTYADSLKKLISDIGEQTIEKDNIIIVITGDIIDQGKYDLHKDAAIKFFKKLKEELKDKVHSIIVVPGNHDKIRTKVNSLISRSHAELDLKYSDDETCQKEWQVYKDSYSGYFELLKEIQSIFEIELEIDNSFYAKLIKVNDINICFVCIDSSWCSHTNNDYRKLRIGDYQLKRLNEEYKSIKNELEEKSSDIDLTIAVSHFPLNWLNVNEEKLCNEYFLSKEFLNVDILMCGHVHDFSVVNYFNHNHSLLTLVTGIGWGIDNPSDEKNKNHRYSIYTLNLFFNSCDILMRKTKDDGNFDYDYSVYAGDPEIRDNKLRYPLKVKESNAHIRVNSLNPIDTKSLFIDKALLERIPFVSQSISSFTTNISGIYNKYKDNFIKKVLSDLFPNYNEYDFSEGDIAKEEKERYNTILNTLNGYFYENKDLSEELAQQLIISDRIRDFNGFLNEICTSTVVEMSGECFSDDTYIRAHFRWHNYANTKDEYPMLCQYSNLPDNEKKESMQIVNWGGLIKSAFETKEPIVYSANKSNNTITTDWEDFITIIPMFSNYSHDIRIRKNQIESRPILTFGISIKNTAKKQDYLTLYLLAFLRFDKVLASIIDDYMCLFKISADYFLSEIQKIRNTKDREIHNND